MTEIEEKRFNDESQPQEQNPASNPEEAMTMSQLLAEEGQSQEAGSSPAFLTAIYVGLVKEGLLVDIGRKREALIPREEFGETIPFKEGDSIPVLRVPGERGEGYFKVSWKAAHDKIAWEEIEKAYSSRTPLTVTVLKETKGGLIVRCQNGLNGFLPQSQIDVRQVSDLKSWKDQTITAYILQYDVHKNNLVLSRRDYQLEINQKKREELFKTLKVGDVFQGVVRGITQYGAFVDIGGVEGLLHIGEVDWAHTKKISQVLKVGQTIEVQAIKFDPAAGKVSLSRKALLPHPWEGVEERFQVGSVVKGRVTHLADFGAFLEIAPNVEGLAHNSEISWEEDVKNPKELLKVGQIYDVRILSVSRAKEKISLSIKRAKLSPWEELGEIYKVGSSHKVKVQSLAPFGAFVKIPEGITGLIHISDFSWTKKIEKPEELLTIGQEIEAKVLEFNAAKEKLSFGMKQIHPNPFEQFHKRQKVTAKVTRIIDAGAYAELTSELEAFIPYSEISSEKFNNPQEVLQVGALIEGIITLVDPKERRIQISIAQLERELQNQAQKKYSKVQGTSLSQLFE